MSIKSPLTTPTPPPSRLFDTRGLMPVKHNDENARIKKLQTKLTKVLKQNANLVASIEYHDSEAKTLATTAQQTETARIQTLQHKLDQWLALNADINSLPNFESNFNLLETELQKATAKTTALQNKRRKIALQQAKAAATKRPTKRQHHRERADSNEDTTCSNNFPCTIS